MALDKTFAAKFNFAAIVMKGDEIVYERYAWQLPYSSPMLRIPLLRYDLS